MYGFPSKEYDLTSPALSHAAIQLDTSGELAMSSCSGYKRDLNISGLPSNLP